MKVRVKVPATTANLGPGFDTIGLALSLHNEFTFFHSPEEVHHDPDNLIYHSAKYIYDRVGAPVDRLQFTVAGEVPMSRGLGSSATCIVGAMVGANELLGRPFSREELLNFATEVEGHPDNIAPALYGGCRISTMEEGRVITHPLDIAPSLHFFVAIPNFPLATSVAREALPKALSYGDAVFNISRMVFLVEGLRLGDFQLVRMGAQDRLHEPYRSKLIRGYGKMASITGELDGVVLISGAGPTLLLIAPDTVEPEAAMELWHKKSQETGASWEIKHLKLDPEGAVVTLDGEGPAARP